MLGLAGQTIGRLLTTYQVKIESSEVSLQSCLACSCLCKTIAYSCLYRSSCTRGDSMHGHHGHLHACSFANVPEESLDCHHTWPLHVCKFGKPSFACKEAFHNHCVSAAKL